MKTILLALFMGLSFCAFAQSQPTEAQCQSFQNGTYTYEVAGDKFQVTLKGNTHVDEKIGVGKVVSKIKWTSPCHGFLTVKSATIPNFPLLKGENMLLSLKKVEGNTYTIWVAAKGNAAEGMLTKK